LLTLRGLQERALLGPQLSLQILLLHRLVDSRAILFGPTLAGLSFDRWLRLLL